MFRGSSDYSACLVVTPEWFLIAHLDCGMLFWELGVQFAGRTMYLIWFKIDDSILQIADNDFPVFDWGLRLKLRAIQSDVWDGANMDLMFFGFNDLIIGNTEFQIGRWDMP
jgi:hypothetical protein